jgi:hypothetical protein
MDICYRIIVVLVRLVLDSIMPLPIGSSVSTLASIELIENSIENTRKDSKHIM